MVFHNIRENADKIVLHYKYSTLHDMHKDDTYWYLRRTCSISLTFEVKNSGLLNIYACCSIPSFNSSSIHQEDIKGIA